MGFGEEARARRCEEEESREPQAHLQQSQTVRKGVRSAGTLI